MSNYLKCAVAALVAVFAFPVMAQQPSPQPTMAVPDRPAPAGITAEDDWESPNVLTPQPFTAGVADEDDWEAPVAMTGLCVAGAECFTGLEIRDYSEDEVPTSGLGLLWRSVTESVSLAFTFDPVKKAEKRVRFAEERMRMAQAMIEKDPTDPKLQDRAMDMVERAQGLMEDIEETRDKWAPKDIERGGQLMKNIGVHTATREATLDRMEGALINSISDAGWSGRIIGPDRPIESTSGRTPEHKVAFKVEVEGQGIDSNTWSRFQDLRADGNAAEKRLMTALENENVPEPVREHLGTVKSRIEAHGEDIRLFQEAQRNMMQVQPGQEGADEMMRNLQRNRQRVLDGRNDVMINGSCLQGGPCEQGGPENVMINGSYLRGDRNDVMINGSVLRGEREGIMINGTCLAGEACQAPGNREEWGSMESLGGPNQPIRPPAEDVVIDGPPTVSPDGTVPPPPTEDMMINGSCLQDGTCPAGTPQGTQLRQGQPQPLQPAPTPIR